MNKKLLLLLFFLISSIIAQTKLQNENIEGNKLTLKFNSFLNYSVKKENQKNIFYVPNYFDESSPGDVKLPSHAVFIALPQLIAPTIKYKITDKKEIKAIPKFNEEVSLNDDGEFVYSKAKSLSNKRNNHFKVKGYLWIEDDYCMHLEVTPAIFIASKNVIELINEFEVELSFNNNISTLNKVSNNLSENSIISNKKYSITNNKKFVVNTDDLWIDYTKKYLKIGVAKDGVYRIVTRDIEAKGIDVSVINPKSFKLILRGNEIPIFVEGEADQQFDIDDYIEFAGIRNMGGKHRELNNYDKPYNEYTGRYTDTTIYWLTWDGVDGKRIKISLGESPVLSDTLKYYSQIDHYEKNPWFDYSCDNLVRRENPYWIENKTWIWGGLNVGVSNRAFSVSDVYPNVQFKAFVKLQDWGANISENAHHFALSLNSNPEIFDSIFVDKYEKVVLSTEFSSDLLADGNNTLKIHSFQTDATINSCFLDWYEVEYLRFLKPFNDSLNFSFQYIDVKGEKTIKLQNINSNNFVLWKLGDSFKKYSLSKNGSTIIFTDTISANDKFSFIDESKIGTPKIYYVKQFKNLRSTENEADYIAITHNKFQNQVDEYSEFISNNYNVDTKVIDILDIYDEYSFGFFNPEAIKDFLKSTQNNWQDDKPKYVVLIGGATYDYYGNKYENFGTDRVINYVPSFGVPVSDNWFITWDTTGAYIPQMNIGRIPVTNNNELKWYIEKHTNYISQKYDDWNKRYLFFSSGDDKSQSEIEALRNVNQFVIDNYTSTAPIGGKSVHFYKTLDPKTDFGPYTTEYVQETINQGALFISYIGHSGTKTWDNSIINHAQLKNNKNRYPIISDFGCSTAKFAEPDVVSFSQSFLLESDGDALAYVGNSSLGFQSTSMIMPKLFYKKILKEEKYEISEAHKLAKIEMLETYGTSGVYELSALTNVFIGDPILTLPIPDKPNFVIHDGGIQLKNSLLTDIQDSAEVSIKIYNYGKVNIDTLNILVVHKFQEKIDSNHIQIEIPQYIDSLKIKLSIKNKAGNHNLIIELDPSNVYNELIEEDNIAQITFNVASSAIRPLMQYQIVNGIDNHINFLNPTTLPNEETIILDIYDKSDLSNLISYEILFDTLISNHSIDELVQKKRYYGRTKIKSESNYSTTFSFISNEQKYYLFDSLSMSKSYLNNAFIVDNDVRIDTTKIEFVVSSAGWIDGNYAHIKRNGINYPPLNVRGHHIAIFDAASYNFVKLLKFDVFDGGSEIERYINFIDTLSNRHFVCISIADEGSNSMTTELRNKIKTLGSQYIDSVSWRGSWAFIGKKGATPGTMPEAYSKSGDGPVTIDTTMSFLSEKGSMLTTEIGATGNWDKLVINQETPSNSTIVYKPIGIKADGELDTLVQLNLKDSTADLSHIDAKLYPKIKILGEFTASDDNQSPILKSLGVDYDLVPELATNYQVVSIEQDSVEQGEDVNLSFYVYNVGESTADSFKVQVEVINPDNSREKIFEQLVDSLSSEQRKLFNVAYNTTSFSGERTFSISIDSENKILELYEDNNFYTIPFYVKGDTTNPSMNITFDGNDIFEGEYISSTPKIKIEMSEPSLVPVTDTSSVSVFLNDKRVHYKANEENLTINYSQSNPKVVVDFTPQLDDGEYELRVFGKDASGNVVDSSGIEKSFIVQSDAKIMDIYNYPNPFADETYFTFKLTQIPDEVKIRIFTIAGRLIKEIILSGTELNYDLNKIYWDGIDTDGDEIGNGVYIYKVIMDVDGEKQVETKKLAVVK